MDDMLKTLIIIVLIYYLLKGLIYLILWQATYKIQEKALAAKAKKKELKEKEKELWKNKHDEE